MRTTLNGYTRCAVLARPGTPARAGSSIFLKILRISGFVFHLDGIVPDRHKALTCSGAAIFVAAMNPLHVEL